MAKEVYQMAPDTELHEEVFAFAQGAQRLALVWLDPRPASRLSDVWAVLTLIPRCDSLADQEVLAEIVWRIVTGSVDSRENPGDITFFERKWNRLRDPRVSIGLQMIQSRSRDSTLNLATVAREVGLTRYHLCRLIKTETACGFRQHLDGVRLIDAISLLGRTTLSVKQIADRAGYRDTAQLDRHFSRWIHISPKQFRCLLANRGNYLGCVWTPPHPA